jgi:hypothetical protein
MRDLVGELIYLSRLDEEDANLQWTAFSLTQAVREAAEPFEGMAEFKGKALKCAVQEDVSMHGDESAIRRLVSVLLDNAVKYAPQDDVINLTLRADGRRAQLTVENGLSGPMDPEVLKHLFDRFYRADESRSRESGGYGIGLSVARAILEKHGLKLSAVQNHYSLLNRSSEESGIIRYCAENGIHFFSYMVLEQGALSGKYDAAHPMPEGSARAETYNPVLDRLEVLNGELKKLAEKYGVGAAQIPVAWAIAKGTLPIIGVTKENQVLDAVKAANIALTAEDTAELEKVADSLDLNVIRFWEKEMK